jgi:hypothetical protein
MSLVGSLRGVPGSPEPCNSNSNSDSIDPVVIGLQRVAAKDFELAGYKVPKGKLLMLPLKYVGAHDARFEQATLHVFMPERMLTAEAQKKGTRCPLDMGPGMLAG